MAFFSIFISKWMRDLQFKSFHGEKREAKSNDTNFDTIQNLPDAILLLENSDR